MTVFYKGLTSIEIREHARGTQERHNGETQIRNIEGHRHELLNNVQKKKTIIQSLSHI